MKENISLVGHGFEVEGDLPKDIKKKIEGFSVTAAQKDNERNTLLAIKRRLAKDEKKISIFLKSNGFFDFRLAHKINYLPNNKVNVKFIISLGAEYKFGDIKYISDGKALKEVDLPDEKGKPFSTKLLLQNEDKILKELTKIGYVSPEIEDRLVAPDSIQKTVEAITHIKPGKKTYFGRTDLNIGDFIEKKFVLNRLKYCEGRLFNQDKLDETRESLVGTEIFDGVVVKHLDPEGMYTPIEVTLSENKRHFVGFGAEYSTQDGIGGRAFWGHRNLWGGGERLRVNFEYLELKKSLRTDLSLPDIGAVNQTWLTTLELAKESFDAYDADIARIKTSLAKPFGKYQRDIGLSFGHETVRDIPFFLVGVPLTFSRNSVEKSPDPSKGLFIQIHAEPTKNFKGEKEIFTILKSQAKTYFKFTEASRFVLAINGKIGSILSQKLEHVPATRLFYIGGASSLRGYKYQYAGPLTNNSEAKDRVPVGGRSFAELATELRYRINDEWGAVVFVDTGVLSQDKFVFAKPKSPINKDEGSLFTGVGLGARYYFGNLNPVRADIAMPLKRRKKIDRFVQFYISFGHSF